jgi:hypothetical protein
VQQSFRQMWTLSNKSCWSFWSKININNMWTVVFESNQRISFTLIHRFIQKSSTKFLNIMDYTAHEKVMIMSCIGFISRC